VLELTWVHTGGDALRNLHFVLDEVIVLVIPGMSLMTRGVGFGGREREVIKYKKSEAVL
jgi:hypothetical protein